MLLECIGGRVPILLEGSVEDLQVLLAGLLPVDHAHLTGHDPEPGVQTGDPVVSRAEILVGQGAHQHLVEIVVRLAEILDLVGVVHQIGKVAQILVGDLVAIGTQGVGLHQQAHFKHTVYVVLGDARNHQTLFRQDGDQPLLLQPTQCIPHGGPADIAHFSAEFLFVEKLVRTVLTVQDLGFQILISLQFQAQFCLRFHIFHTFLLLTSFQSQRTVQGYKSSMLVSLKPSN